jgi:hypothetical protein
VPTPIVTPTTTPISSSKISELLRETLETSKFDTLRIIIYPSDLDALLRYIHSLETSKMIMDVKVLQTLNVVVCNATKSAILDLQDKDFVEYIDIDIEYVAVEEYEKTKNESAENATLVKKNEWTTKIDDRLMKVLNESAYQYIKIVIICSEMPEEFIRVVKKMEENESVRNVSVMHKLRAISCEATRDAVIDLAKYDVVEKVELDIPIHAWMTPTPVETPTKTPIKTPPKEEIQTPTEKSKTSGFEAIMAVVGLVVTMYLLRRAK